MAAVETATVVSDQTETDVNDTDVEVELEDFQERITDPFDPERIKIRTVNIVVDQLVSRISHHEIDLAPDFQRLRGIWRDSQKSRLIESLLLRIPIPLFYVSANESDIWSVVDGIQRMSTIYDFINGEFTLNGLEYLSQLDGKGHDELPRAMQRRISETQLVINVIEPGTPAEVMFNVFHRINTGGMTLNGQEIRHAMYPGGAREYLMKLADSDEFQEATDGSINQMRMADRECVLRFLAFHIRPWESYSAKSLDSYLGSVMEELNLRFDQDAFDELEDDFKRAMVAASKIFGKDAFRKPRAKNGRRRPINRALFEAWSVELARCSAQDISTLVRGRRAVQLRFRRLMKDDGDFERSVSYSTGSQQRVLKRFQSIKEIVADAIL